MAGDAYDAEERIVVAGYDNGDIKMFDLKKMAIRWEANVKNGVHDLLLFAKLLGKCTFTLERKHYQTACALFRSDLFGIETCKIAKISVYDNNILCT